MISRVDVVWGEGWEWWWQRKSSKINLVYDTLCCEQSIGLSRVLINTVINHHQHDFKTGLDCTRIFLNDDPGKCCPISRIAGTYTAKSGSGFLQQSSHPVSQKEMLPTFSSSALHCFCFISVVRDSQMQWTGRVVGERLCQSLTGFACE